MTDQSAAGAANGVVSFHRMEDGTREDYELLERAEREYIRALPDRILAALGKLDQSLPGYPVSRLEHSLQAATRALNDGADNELIVAALIHDVGDDLAPYNHAEIAAGIIRPYVRAEVTSNSTGCFRPITTRITAAAIEMPAKSFAATPGIRPAKISAPIGISVRSTLGLTPHP